MSSTQLIPPADYSGVDPVRRWLSASQNFKDYGKGQCTTTRVCYAALCATSIISYAAAGGLGIAGCVTHKTGGILYAFWSTLLSGGFFGVSAIGTGKVADRQEKETANKIAAMETLTTFEPIVKIRFELLSNPPALTGSYPYLVEMGVLSPEIYARCEKLLLKLQKLDNENPCKDMPKEAVRANPILSAKLDRNIEDYKKWNAKWEKFRPELERDLPNPQSELELNPPREELELFE